MWEDEIVVNGDDTVFYDVVVEQSHPANGRPFLQIRVHKVQRQRDPATRSTRGTTPT